MPKEKKDAKIVNFYLKIESIEKLDKYCKTTGLSKTVAVERFIDQCTNKNDRKKVANSR